MRLHTETMEFLVDVALAFPVFAGPVSKLLFRQLDRSLCDILATGDVREIEEALEQSAEVTPNGIADLRQVIAEEYGDVENFTLNRDASETSRPL